MDVSGVPAPAVVAAAPAGGREALIAGYLPLVYTVAGRALRRPSEVDDAVRETMRHVVAGFDSAPDQQSVRSWVVAVTVREIRSAHRRRMAAGKRPGAEAPEDDPGADLVDLTIARLGLSDQQRETVEATRWLDALDRELLALWWLEVCGELTRAEVAAALGVSSQHATSRVRRMRARLQTARVVVRAVGDRAAAQPRCAALGTVLVPWDRRPHAVWRKRIARHTRQCLACGAAWAGLADVERLVAGFALLAPPAALAAAVSASVRADLRAAQPSTAVDAAASAVGEAAGATGSAGGPAAGSVGGPAAGFVGEAAGAAGTAVGAAGTAVGAAGTAVSAAGTAVSAAGTAVGAAAGTGGPSRLIRAVRFLTSTPVIGGTMAAVLVAGGILAFQLIFIPLRGGAGSGVSADRTGATDAPAAGPPVAGPSTGTVPGADPVFTNTVPGMAAVTTVTEMGPIRQHSRVSARDNGQSVRYGDRSVWIFADTVFRNPWGFRSNTGAVTGDLTASDGVSVISNNPFTVETAADPEELIPRTEAEHQFEDVHFRSGKCTNITDRYCGVAFAFWPGPVIADPARGRILMFYGKLCRGGAPGTPCSGPLGKALGSGIAAMDMRTHRVTRLTATGRPVASSIEGADPTIFFPPSGEYTAGALTVGETAYVYGACSAQGCKLARVGLAEIADRSRWTFFAGRDPAGTDRWSTDPARSVNTIAAGSAGNSVLWNPTLRCFMNLLLPKATNKAVFQVGGSPFGPWSGTRPLLDTAAPAGHQVNYALFGHAEYAERGGLVQYVTYYQPDTGHTRLVRITFAPAG